MTVTEALLRGAQCAERGWIIRILADTTVGETDASMVRSALSMLRVPIDRLHYRNHLEYLQERGYVRLARVSLGDISNTTVCLTAAGRDLRSGVTNDPGVDVAVGD